jgi:hypothetical protein
MVYKALVLENRRGIMERKRKMQRTGSQGSNTRFCVGSSSQGPISDLVSRVDNPECKLQVKDFKLFSDKFSAPTSNLLALHRRHLKGTTMYIILVLWDHAIVAVRVDTMLIGVQGSRQIRLQPQAQIRTSTAMPTTVHLLWQGRIKLVLV